MLEMRKYKYNKVYIQSEKKRVGNPNPKRFNLESVQEELRPIFVKHY